MARNATPEVFTKAFANNPHIVWFQHRVLMIGPILGGGTDEIVLFAHSFRSACRLGQPGAQFLHECARGGGWI